MFKFEIVKNSKKSKARIGQIKTPHGTIKTPAFIPVATLGTIKGGLDFRDLKLTKIQCQIVNTFHFLDLNRVNEIKKAGGLHNFFNFQKPIFTDSGGFQVFSLGKGQELGLGKISSIFPKKKEITKKTDKKLVKKITQKGILFVSPRSGKKIYLTPQLSAKTQKQLGADFVYLLDICGSPLDSFKEAKKEMELSHLWFGEFLKVKLSSHQRIFGIIQGGIFKNLREESTRFVNNLPVFGIAIGGALGKSKQEMYKILSWINQYIDWQRPHHLLGIGDLEVMEKIIQLGIDLFDCALPTRIARHGTALTSKGYLNLKKAKLRGKFRPLQKGCQCFTCQNYSIAQINFLFKAKEMLGGRLLTIHNLYFLEKKLETIREKIEMNKL